MVRYAKRHGVAVAYVAVVQVNGRPMVLANYRSRKLARLRMGKRRLSDHYAATGDKAYPGYLVKVTVRSK